MKKIILLLLIFSTFGCIKKLYISNEYFDCNTTSDFTADTARKQLIYAILDRTLISKKDVHSSGFLHISDNNKIYINNAYYPEFMGGSDSLKPYLIDRNEIPNQIDKVQICLKSKSELQEIADKTSDFLYLTLGNIEIDGDTAKIGLLNSWVVSKKNKGKYALMSGGGYILTYKKVNGKWIYDVTATHLSWQS